MRVVFRDAISNLPVDAIQYLFPSAELSHELQCSDIETMLSDALTADTEQSHVLVMCSLQLIYENLCDGAKWEHQIVWLQYASSALVILVKAASLLELFETWSNDDKLTTGARYNLKSNMYLRKDYGDGAYYVLKHGRNVLKNVNTIH